MNSMLTSLQAFTYKLVSLRKKNMYFMLRKGAFHLVRTQFYMLSGPPPPFLHVIRNGNVCET